MAIKKKLIEVALPLEAINAESAREKSIRHGHPSTLHLWWARRPLATARAVIWSSLVDDPSSHPEQFPTEEAQQQERERLFAILTKLVKWENSNDEAVLAEAKAEIMKSTDGNPPALLDPFAGGGAIPMEAQRLGLEAHAHDLNPVAVMINKAMIEIPPKFAGQAPVNPQSRAQMGGSISWKGAAGLAEDVRYYGEWMKQEAFKRIGHLYPKVQVPKEQGGGEATVIAWIWARTVKCPNPACGCEMPLASSFVLSKKKGKEAWIEPVCEQDNTITYHVRTGKCPKDKESVKLGKGGLFSCVACNTATTKQYVHDEFIAKRVGAVLMAVVAEGKNGRVYLSPTSAQSLASQCSEPENAPTEEMNTQTPNLVSGRGYGITHWKQLFTNRQLTALTTFSALVGEAQKKVEADAVAAGIFNDHIPLAEGGTGARAYGEAVGVYLAFAVDREANYSSSLNAWAGDFIVQTFGRQALPMVWDFAESNPFSASTGSFHNAIEWIYKCFPVFPATKPAFVKQFDAQSNCGLSQIMVSTDPPYYDNIGYADLSDYFYIWMRQALKNTYLKLFHTMLVPKEEELIASPYRFGGDVKKARDFFEEGMFESCCQIYQYAREDLPVTIYYAFKQSENDVDGEDVQTASTGWETMLSAVLSAGFAIVGTWPMRTERSTGLKASVNALASSIVLVCRKRPQDARSVTRREFINALHREMRPALEKLQSANIAPVDLAQSAIGPGIGVFSRFKSVLESDGKPMGVRAALQIINQELDAFYNEQEGELDRESRFCVELFSQYSFNNLKFGDADILARAKNTSVQALAEHGVMLAAKGQVRLLTREEIPEKVDSHEECTWLLTQQLARAMEKGGVQACADIVDKTLGSNAENTKALAYRLYTICERRNWAQEGYAYNNLVTAWPDIQSRVTEMRAQPKQIRMDI